MTDRAVWNMNVVKMMAIAMLISLSGFGDRKGRLILLISMHDSSLRGL